MKYKFALICDKSMGLTTNKTDRVNEYNDTKLLQYIRNVLTYWPIRLSSFKKSAHT